MSVLSRLGSARLVSNTHEQVGRSSLLWLWRREWVWEKSCCDLGPLTEGSV